ncbi:hypothetical protein A2130_04130 [Candidatus Woesebacteria bacterium GWC2_33_12]|uniref:Uncharacterized protein n=1 Tax=Candidatus Woesebacteria bacterium GW2011_GWB1_33_22 TaxID=1618566 RepID=A0A0F9ZN65_9BACT|nr:MAG: hypothetical protein UR29_C0001G0149 [Candidatus Woesebacteria bacterium GW2011_GWC2_33_12]KKP42641.1 MAG: hypothetical protein UR33_C0001G0002 [Candidatus Woesebacteria bacterium GW2011_GWA2_33_20]KKP45584.1 MAG: hypothetical protein UR35_C0001G0181 [Candidatus Woesebacteria bacterium GW2011_GWB1_33_22]KKP47456.1 MAG: hypothetical protein UR37_C0001G0149 [Microgenomates group bacterium GW2011_GWC1_33_28]KKP51202.1 MAG: hypothetical protein UR41_C0001G0149 [Candidatus Woesebacteria bact
MNVNLEYVPIPAAGDETIDQAIDKWLKQIRNMAQIHDSDLIKSDDQLVLPEETDKIPTPL